MGVYVTFGILSVNGNRNVDCKSVLFVLSGDVQILISVMFICFAFYIDAKAKYFLKEKEAKIELEQALSEDANRSAREKIEKVRIVMKRSLYNMWVIVLSLAFCNLFAWLYSQILLSSNKVTAPSC